LWFDFNKSTLQPASDPVLQKVTDLLLERSGAEVEVQGIRITSAATANNQTLSSAARAVMDWLIQHVCRQDG